MAFGPQKIGFVDFAIQKNKSECNVYMTSTIYSIMEWCTQYYQ